MKCIARQIPGAVLCTLQLFFFVLPARAANRNDFLFDLKDTFNSPVSSKTSMSGMIIGMATIALLILFFFAFSAEQNKRRSIHRLNQYKRRMQKKAGKQSDTGPQKRKWFRMATKTEFRWIPAEQASSVRTNRYKLDRLVNISGGGMCFTSKESLQAGDHIKILLTAGRGGQLFLDGRVVRAVWSNEIYKISVEFEGIRDGQRDRIVAWIMERQRLTIHGEKPEKKRLGSEE